MFVISGCRCEIEGEFASVYVWMYVCLCIQVIIWEGRYVWAWMLIRAFVSDKQLGNGIKLYVRVSVWLRKCFLLVGDLCVRLCTRVCACMCMYVAIRCVLIWTCRATWYSTPLISCLSSTRMGIATGKIESLRSWKACMQMRQIYLFSPSKTSSAFSSLSTQPSSLLFSCLPSFSSTLLLHTENVWWWKSQERNTGKKAAACFLCHQ